MSHPTLDLKRAYLALRRALEQTLKPFNVSAAQFDVLQLLLHNDGLEHREMQRRLAISSPTLTNILDVLERNGHIIRKSVGSDARVKTIHMSQKSLRLCSSEAFCAAGDSLVREMFRGFTAQQRRDLLQDLGKIEANLDRISG